MEGGEIPKRKRMRNRKRKKKPNIGQAEQAYKDTFIEDSTKKFQTPDGQEEKLTELFDDNSHAPVTAGPKKVTPMNTFPPKMTQGPDDIDFTVDMFDDKPIVQTSSQIKLNLTGKATTQSNKAVATAGKFKSIGPPIEKSPVFKGQINTNITRNTSTPAKVFKTGGIKNVPKLLQERPNLTVIDPKNIQPTKPNVVVPAQKPTSNQGAKPTQAKPMGSNTAVTVPGPKPVQAPTQATAQAQKSLQTTAQTQKPVQTTAQNQPTGFKGRMTAASFLTYSAVPNQMSMGWSTPKGIPKSFLATQPGHVPNVTAEQKPPPLMQNSVPNPYVMKPRVTGQPTYNDYRYEGAGELSSSIDQSYRGPNPYQGTVVGQNPQAPNQGGQQIGQSGQYHQSEGDNFGKLYVNIDNNEEQRQQYSPSDIYADNLLSDGFHDDREQSGSPESCSKRLSAFQRLGPPTQAKKPKLIINLLVDKDQSVREVVDSSPEEDKYTPVHLRPDIQTSTDETVMKYLVFWPFKKNAPPPRRQVTARHSKSVMLLELEQMEEAYERDNAFFLITVTGYPPSWSKENVLDALLESVKGKSFIPCFIEFLKHECKFLVIRSKPALLAIHKFGFIIHKEDVELHITIAQLILSTNQIEFIPRLVLRKRLMLASENEFELNLSEFTTKSDISHFIYFPLNRAANQSELIHLHSTIPWMHLTKLNLSRNRITTISGFSLENMTPSLKHLDLSHNYIDNMSDLIQCRQLPLNTLVLEGNPVCLDFMQEMYLKALKMIFPGLSEIDGVKLTKPGDFPKMMRNYCPEDARAVVEKVLEVMFPLLDAKADDRLMIEDLYDVNAMMTITFMYKLRYGTIYKEHRSLFNRARWLEEGDAESVQGAPAIAKLLYRWPSLCHDPTTFTVDVLYHTLTTTIIRISGILKVTAESLAENEHLLAFTRTLVLNTIDCVEYKITNEMLYWDLPDKEITRNAFRQTTGRSKNLNLKLESPPDEDLKENLVNIFMKLTDLDRKTSIRCLEEKEWHIKNALEYFCKLLKLDNVELLLK